MSEEDIDAIEKTLDQMKKMIFNCHCVVAQPMSFVFEFDSPNVAAAVEKKCGDLGMTFKRVGDPKRPLAVQVVMDDITRTQFLIAQQCAKKKAAYKRKQREVDFVCYGEDWKAPAELAQESYTIRQKTYFHTYGANKV